MNAFWVFLGGGIGATLRWGLAAMAPAPWGTVGVNVVGSALLAAMLHPGVGLSDPMKLLLCTGVMGGFTTYSTFNHDVLASLQAGNAGQAATTASVTLVVCLVSGFGGWFVAERLVGV
jgi:fluoride exporter